MASTRRYITNKGQVRYTGRWREYGGASREKGGFSRQRVALGYAKEQEVDISRDEYISPATATTVSAQVAHYLKVGLKHSLSHSTVVGYQRAFRNYIESDRWTIPGSSEKGAKRNHHIGDVVLTDLTPNRIKQWQREIADGRSARTAASVRQLLFSACEFAVIVDSPPRMKKNPVRAVPGFGTPDVERLFLSRGEVGQLIEAAIEFEDSTGYPNVALFIETLAQSGMRFGELAALHGRDIDFTNGKIKVSANLLRSGERAKKLKSRSSRRTIRVPDSTLNRLAKLIGRTNEPVFTAPLGGYVGYNNFQKRVWRKVVKAADLDVEGKITLHTLRHFHGAACIQDGMGLKQLQVRLGHKSISTTGDIYSHVFEDYDDGVAGFVDIRVLPQPSWTTEAAAVA